MSAPTSPPVRVLTRSLCADVLGQARASSRRRKNFNFHTGADDNPHRFLNVMLQGTYVQPHRHADPPKAEAFLVLEGRLAVLLFDEAGTVTAAHVLTAGGEQFGVDLPPGVWHSLVVLSEEAICYEVKPGPYCASNDKEFASWAPAEGEEAAAAYLQSLLEETAALTRV